MVICVYIFNYKLTASDFSIVFIVLYVFCYFYLVFNGMNYASLFSLYYISFGVFIGGRFIYVFIADSIIGWEVVSLSKLFDLDFLVTTAFSYKQILETYFLILSWAILPCAGYLLVSSSNKEIHFSFTPSQISRAFWLSIFFFLMQLPEQLQAIYLVWMKGYFALYSDFDFSKVNQYAKYFFLLCGAVALTDEKYRKWIFILFIMNGGLSGVTGARGTLITLLFSLIFISGLFKRIALFRLLLLMIMLYLMLFALTFLSPRYSESAVFSHFIYDLLNFFYARGGVIGVIGYSIHSVGDISLSLKLGWLFPGVGRIVALLTDLEIKPENESISRVISYVANPVAFMDGQGLGSSIISESYLITGGLFSACFVSLIFGCTLGCYEKYMRYNKIIFMAVIAISPNIFFSVRDSLDSMYMLAFKFIIFAYILYFFISKFTLCKRRFNMS
ncbi:TPA: O-antigen polysaccharide polymerase Wzy [Citrobacter braakii]